MTDQITPEGICSTCGKELSAFELFHECCVSCGGYPVCECKGIGCKKCAGLGSIKQNKNYQYGFRTNNVAANKFPS
jgi:hypothetical protein